jgi:hypothetical protein
MNPINLSTQGVKDFADSVKSTIACGAFGCAVSNSIQNKAMFDNVPKSEPMSSGALILLIILFVMILVLYILSMVAVFRLTNGSALQTILYFFFGAFYLTPALIYYAFNGYTLKSSSSNNNNNSRR